MIGAVGSLGGIMQCVMCNQRVPVVFEILFDIPNFNWFNYMASDNPAIPTLKMPKTCLV